MGENLDRKLNGKQSMSERFAVLRCEDRVNQSAARNVLGDGPT